MPSFLETNWQVILSSFGITTALIAIGGYLWSRFILWIERNDLKSQKSRIDTIKELLELRNEFSEKNKAEEILVHTILKTATTREILRLSSLINRKNSGIKYYLKQATLFIICAPIITSLAFCCVLFMTSGEVWIGISAFLGAAVITLFAAGLSSEFSSDRENSSRLIASTIIGAESKEDVDAIIIKALQGEDILTKKKDS